MEVGHEQIFAIFKELVDPPRYRDNLFLYPWSLGSFLILWLPPWGQNCFTKALNGATRKCLIRKRQLGWTDITPSSPIGQEQLENQVIINENPHLCFPD
jgi:hypothetical protein